MSRKLQTGIVFVLFMIILSVTTAEAIEIDLKKTTARYDEDGVIVTFNYDLDPVQRLKGIIFGASYIEEDILSLFGDVKLKVKRIDFEHAELLLPVVCYNDTAYFSGVKLNEALPELTLVFPGNSTVTVKNATEIPQAFYSAR